MTLYISASKKHVAFLFLVGFFLLVAVSATFAYKDARYGIDKLPNVVARQIERYSMQTYYYLAFGIDDVLTANSAPNLDRGAHAVPALVYHAIGDTGGYAVTRSIFAAQMRTLYEHGWHTVTLSEFENFLRGTQTLPERSFLLTFDDGAKESYYPVDPVLAVLGMSAVSFVLPRYSLADGSHYYLSLGELDTMLESGRWEIGSHGQDSHQLVPINEIGDTAPALSRPAWLRKLEREETQAEYEARIESDLRVSRHNLEQALGTPVTSFAFPFGEFGQLNDTYPAAITTVSRIADGIYGMSFHQVRRGEAFSFNYPETTPPRALLLKRIEPLPGTSAAELLARMENGLPKDLPFTDDFSTERGWFSVWGPYVHTRDALVMATLPGETGSALVLDGTRHWKDYELRLTVHSLERTGVYLWVRFQGNAQHAGCNFGNGFIHVEETLDDATHVMQGVRLDDIVIPSGDFTVSARVTGRRLTCTLDGVASATSEFLDPMLDSGGIGIKIWDREQGVARLVVKSLRVEPL